LLLCRIAANADPVRDRGPRRTVPAHFIETVASQQAKRNKQPREPSNQLPRHSRFRNPHSGQLGRPRADLVHPYMVAKAVEALRVVAKQQIRLLASQQSSQLLSRFLKVRPREPGPAGRVFEQDRPVPAVRVAQMHDLLRAQDRSASP
jgi:hypothetical protein